MYDFFTIADYICPLDFRASSMEQLCTVIYKAESYDSSKKKKGIKKKFMIKYISNTDSTGMTWL